MNLPFFNSQTEDGSITETYASTTAPSDRLPTPTRGWSPPRDVVIGACVCAVMGLITYAVVQPIRQSRMRQQCLSNLRQMGRALSQYTRDYDEKFPPLFVDGDQSRRFDSVKDAGWAQTLQPYIKNQWVTQCPAENNQPDWRDSLRSGYSDYFYNSGLAGVSVSRIPFESELVCYGDHRTGNAANYLTPSNPLDPVAARRHFKGANYSFVDGHVKFMEPARISTAVAAHGRYSLRFGRHVPTSVSSAR